MHEKNSNPRNIGARKAKGQDGWSLHIIINDISKVLIFKSYAKWKIVGTYFFLSCYDWKVVTCVMEWHGCHDQTPKKKRKRRKKDQASKTFKIDKAKKHRWSSTAQPSWKECLPLETTASASSSEITVLSDVCTIEYALLFYMQIMLSLSKRLTNLDVGIVIKHNSNTCLSIDTMLETNVNLESTFYNQQEILSQFQK